MLYEIMPTLPRLSLFDVIDEYLLENKASICNQANYPRKKERQDSPFLFAACISADPRSVLDLIMRAR